MAKFVIGKEIVTSDPTIDVEPSLAVGRHVFQVVVEDASGNQSAPAQVEVIVLNPTAPTAVIELTSGPAVADRAFVLAASKSADARGGVIKKYRWTLVQTPASPFPRPTSGTTGTTPPILITPDRE
jgi:hypothetical protein